MKNKRVIALGFFDGVHRGHAQLLLKAGVEAAAIGAASCVLTFDRHPGSMIVKQRVPLINSIEDRELLIKRLYGIDEVITEKFDDDMMHMPWDVFIKDYLVEKLGAAYLVVGHDYRFGYRGEGNIERLAEMCALLGIGLAVIPKVQHLGITVSSTYIRGLISQGEIERAKEFLGHPHCLSGEVVHGRKLGRTIDAPTANLIIPEGIIVPSFGVYATKVFIQEREYSAVTNVGVRPTVGYSSRVTVEPFILDFSELIYGQTIRVDFHYHIRGERAFASLDELKAEIQSNAAQVRRLFA